MINLNRLKRSGGIDHNLYAQRANQIADTIETLEKEQLELKTKDDARMDATKRIKDIMEVINNVRATDRFDGEVFKRLVEEVIVKDRMLTFNFKVGIKKTISI